MNLFTKILLDTSTSTLGQQGKLDTLGGNIGSILMTVLPLVALVAVFYFLLIRPQRKQQKETEKMRSNITVGDKVTTIGGIVGTVRQIKDDGELYVIETGADNDKLTIHKWAIQSKDTISE